MKVYSYMFRLLFIVIFLEDLYSVTLQHVISKGKIRKANTLLNLNCNYKSIIVIKILKYKVEQLPDRS